MITIESNKNFEVKSIMTVRIDGKDHQFIVTKKQDEIRLESYNQFILTCEDLRKIVYEMYCKGIADQQLGVNIYLAAGKVISVKDIMTIGDDIRKAVGGDFTDLVTVFMK